MNTKKGVRAPDQAAEPRGLYQAQSLGDDAWAEPPHDPRLELRRNVGQYLAKARGTRKRPDVAAALGVHPNTLAKWERGEASPDAVDLLRLSDLYGCSVAELLGLTTTEPGEVPPATHAVEVGRHLYVPRFDVSAAAGHGAFNSHEAVTDMRPFTRDYIRGTLGIAHNELAIISVAGASMEPDIHSGDAVLIDRRDTSIAIEGPHLVRIDGGLLVKLAQRRPGGVVRISSRNPAYEPFEIVLGAEGHDDNGDFEVLGRVRWAGVTFR